MRSINVGLGAAMWVLALHCAGGRPTAADAEQALRSACEALAVQVSEGSAVTADEVIRKACHVERVVADMRALVHSREAAELVEVLEEWAPRARDAGAQSDGGPR